MAGDDLSGDTQPQALTLCLAPLWSPTGRRYGPAGRGGIPLPVSSTSRRSRSSTRARRTVSFPPDAIASTLLEIRLRSASSSCTGSARSRPAASGASHLDLDARVFEHRAGHLADAPHQCAKVRSLARDGWWARRIECRADDRRHFGDLILNGFQPIDRGRFRWRRLDQQLNIAGDQIQWGPNLVGHIGRSLPQCGQAAGPRELLAQHGHLAMTVSDFHALLPERPRWPPRRARPRLRSGVRALGGYRSVPRAMTPISSRPSMRVTRAFRLAGRGPLHRLAHVREPPVHQQPCRLIDEERHEQDAAQGEPECRPASPDARTCGD